ncbi:hypothetical protein [Empedobacter tilapiae]|uniref:Uncharacterized protein n=1 Tax=Empedobacter tilapiae TaxID=2491114 RepID=A0A4Z1B309_9FLAO|nr:hypothetical protein [Empedobacter tilapiae]TGN21914.1 hypothetical protein E4J94_16590 [Empedobacter tilapiae]
MKLLQILIFIIFFVSNCYPKKCENSTIKIDEIVLDKMYEHDIEYCTLVNNSLKGDKLSFKEIIFLDVNFLDGESAYLHSYYIYIITKKLGGNHVSILLKDLSENELKSYYSILNSGIHYENINKNIKNEFPKLYKELWKNKNPINN